MSTTPQERVGFQFACCQCKVGNRFKNSTCETCQHKMCSSCTMFTPLNEAALVTPEASQSSTATTSAKVSCCKCKVPRSIEIEKCRVCGHNKCLLCPFPKSPPRTPPPGPPRRHSRTPPKTPKPARTLPPPPPFRLPSPASKKPAPKKPSQSAARTGFSP